MKYECQLCVDEDVFELFKSECKTQNRSSLTITADGGKTFFLIRAKDAVALRSSLNLVSKLLTVHEKMKRLV